MKTSRISPGGSAFLVMASLATAICGMGGCGSTQERPEHVWTVDNFRSDACLTVCSALQALPVDERIRRLEEFAASAEQELAVIVICRMLFQARDGGEFRGAFLGAGFGLGGTDNASWPLEPIVISHGVPFLVIRGYVGGGSIETAYDYLRYCLSNCVWTETRYKREAPAVRLAALAELIRSTPWRKPLSVAEINILINQILEVHEPRLCLARKSGTPSLRRFQHVGINEKGELERAGNDKKH